MDDLLQEFIAETRETLDALSGEIVLWEANPTDRTRLDAIFRFVHTVKGSCGFLDLPRLGRLAHAAEDVLAAVREGTRAPDTALVNAVLAIVDRIGELTEAIAAGSPLDDTTEDLLIAALAEDALPIAPAAAGPQTRIASRSVRLAVDLLDRMMAGMSDMVLARNELARRLRDQPIDPRVEGALERLSLTVGEMRDTISRTRMQRIEALFSAMPRMVRDTATPLGKLVTLDVEGADVELDREMIELLRDPLVHIIRNAVDHGIEPPALRHALGKREAGRLLVSARQTGNQIVLEVTDDGRGIDVDRLVAKAAAAGLHSEAKLAAMTERQRLELIFAPGLSSRDTATAISGRGVGMDVVRANIEQIGGRIALRNRPGAGLTIELQVPLTLSIIPAIVVGVGEQRFALPRQSIEEIVAIRGDAVRVDDLGDSRVATVRGRRLPLVDLASLLGIDGGRTQALAIVGTRDGNFALGIGAVLDSEELVVKPVCPAVMGTGIYAGQTLPDSGLPMLLLDGAGVAAAAGLRFTPKAIVDENEAAAQERGIDALLFDDLDGRRRALPLAAVDRVETVSATAIQRTGGRLHLSIEGGVVPLVTRAEPPTTGQVTLLRLTDGVTEIGYPIRDAHEIVTLPVAMAPVRDRPGIAGVAVVNGEQVEVVDGHALFAGELAPPVVRPLCLLHHDGTGWMETFLRPVLEASGYRCASTLAPGETAAVTLAMDDDPPAASANGDPVVLLRSRPAMPGEAGIYRYDRAALIAAVAAEMQSHDDMRREMAR
ncbi:chemotaxis protein CheA [Sphingomonas sp. CFBP 8760]|uniref:chemotaxis protein CheA n=1 Tax=Sphingomonas sp. CFBP 8760 TaxID=2775282 RepID=UPI00177C1939|nr:chemotaxis protein CheW [Sphingomonas sp. CFBP 8760]MBD8545714.1 chemotaxis protein CheW [Sphingomonas sp. CFBP 8760]